MSGVVSDFQNGLVVILCDVADDDHAGVYLM
jgi:hypothetical protein